MLKNTLTLSTFSTFVKRGLFFSWISITSLHAVSMNFVGTIRSEADYYGQLGLGMSNLPLSKSFASLRALLQTELLIDDHLSVRGEINPLSSPNYTPNPAKQLGPGQGGYIFGDPNTNYLTLSRIWVEWLTDYGILRVGRMPFSWGYGLVWDSGLEIWDDFQTTLDRIEYRLHLGNITGGLAYSKARKLSVLDDLNDAQYYSVFAQYEDTDSDIDAGALFEKEAHSTSQSIDYTTTNPYTGASTNNTPTGGQPNPYIPPYQTMPYPIDSQTVDIYLKKKLGSFSYGAELCWLTGQAASPFNSFSSNLELNAYAGKIAFSYDLHDIKFDLQGLYASGDSNFSDTTMGGFVILHRNRRPGLILGRELLGPFYGNNVAQGSLVVYGAPYNSYSGVMYIHPSFDWEWIQNTLNFHTDIIWAQKASYSVDAQDLGVEVDAHVNYAFQRNLDASLALGYLFAGAGLGDNNGGYNPYAIRLSFISKF